MRSRYRSDRRLRRAAAVGLTFLAGCGGADSEPPARVVIPAGTSLRAATDSLARAGVVAWPRVFRAYAALGGHDRALKPGTYMLRRGAPWSEILEAMTAGKSLIHTVIVPEGYALSAIVPLLARSLGVPAESAQAAVRDTSVLRRLDVPTSTLEGYLFPATYSFRDNTSARAAVGQMVREFERRWRPEWNARLQALAMSRNEIVTLASIVEKEARLPEERPVIAAVYHNRLQRRMLLQADPTVQYALGRHTDRVLYKDLQIDSPYNTYRHPGLPPGPIASPGEASIQAALFPASVPYLFFVAHPDGHHEFRVTFAEHAEAREEVRRARTREDGAR